MNQVLGIGIEKICLLLLNVVASLPRALLVDTLRKTSSLNNPPHHVKVDFIGGGDGGGGAGGGGGGGGGGGEGGGGSGDNVRKAEEKTESVQNLM